MNNEISLEDLLHEGEEKLKAIDLEEKAILDNIDRMRAEYVRDFTAMALELLPEGVRKYASVEGPDWMLYVKLDDRSQIRTGLYVVNEDVWLSNRDYVSKVKSVELRRGWAVGIWEMDGEDYGPYLGWSDAKTSDLALALAKAKNGNNYERCIAECEDMQKKAAQAKAGKNAEVKEAPKSCPIRIEQYDDSCIGNRCAWFLIQKKICAINDLAVKNSGSPSTSELE
jgi:hypothetical protein